MTNWIKVEDGLPEDGEPVWVLNKRRMELWEHDFSTSKYTYEICDAFFERCRGWVLINMLPEKRINVCFWTHKELPENLND